MQITLQIFRHREATYDSLHSEIEIETVKHPVPFNGFVKDKDGALLAKGEFPSGQVPRLDPIPQLHRDARTNLKQEVKDFVLGRAVNTGVGTLLNVFSVIINKINRFGIKRWSHRDIS